MPSHCDQLKTNFLIFVSASEAAIEKLPHDSFRAEFTCPICNGQAYAQARKLGKVKSLSAGGCRKCGMSVVV